MYAGVCRTIYREHTRFSKTYLDPYPGYYFTGDGAYRDKQGHYWITGRIDDTLNVAGKSVWGRSSEEIVLVMRVI